MYPTPGDLHVCDNGVAINAALPLSIDSAAAIAELIEMKGLNSMKKSFGAKTIIFPAPVWCVGSYDANGNPNVMTIAWGGICCSIPPCVTISLRKATYTYGNIIENMLGDDGKPDIKKIRPPVFSQEVQQYHGIGAFIGKAFEIGKKR